MTESYWVDNLREPVLFGDQVARLVREGVHAFVEMSPHPILLPAVEQVAAENGGGAMALPSLRRNEDERDTLLASLGRLHVLGAATRVDRALTPARRGRKLPHYPWQRERFWHERSNQVFHIAAGLAPHRGLLGERIDSAVQPGTHYWQMDFSAETAAMGDHRIGGAAVVPGAGFVEMSLAAARQVLEGDGHTLSDVLFQQPVLLPESGLTRIQVVLEGSQEPEARIRFFVPEENGPVCVAQASLSVTTPGQGLEAADISRLAQRMNEMLDGPDYYRALATCGLGYGPAYRGISHIARTDTEALARVRTDTSAQPHAAGYVVPPMLLDSALQAALAPLLGSEWNAAGGFLSEGMGRVTVHGAAHDEVWAHAVCRADGANQCEVDVRVYGLDGTLLVEVVGMRIVRLESVPVLAAPQPEESAASGQVPLAASAGGLRVTIAALASGPERRAALESVVRENVAQVVKLPARRVDPDRPLKSLGIDSLMSLELRNRLEGVFGIRLSATLIWNYPTIHDIVPFLAEKLGLEFDDDVATVQAPMAVPTGDGGGGVPSSAESPEELLERELAELNERMETI